MQKFKIILINVVAIIVILTIADFVFFEIEKRDYLKECETSNGFFFAGKCYSFCKKYSDFICYSGRKAFFR